MNEDIKITKMEEDIKIIKYYFERIEAEVNFYLLEKIFSKISSFDDLFELGQKKESFFDNGYNAVKLNENFFAMKLIMDIIEEKENLKNIVEVEQMSFFQFIELIEIQLKMKYNIENISTAHYLYNTGLRELGILKESLKVRNITEHEFTKWKDFRKTEKNIIEAKIIKILIPLLRDLNSFNFTKNFDCSLGTIYFEKEIHGIDPYKSTKITAFSDLLKGNININLPVSYTNILKKLCVNKFFSSISEYANLIKIETDEITGSKNFYIYETDGRDDYFAVLSFKEFNSLFETIVANFKKECTNDIIDTFGSYIEFSKNELEKFGSVFKIKPPQ